MLKSILRRSSINAPGGYPYLAAFLGIIQEDISCAIAGLKAGMEARDIDLSYTDGQV